MFYPFNYPYSNYYNTYKILPSHNLNIDCAPSLQNFTCHNTNILINNLNTNNPLHNHYKINKNPLISEDLENYQQQDDEKNMLGKIRERSIKNNKLVYVHAKVSAPLKKKSSLNNKETSKQNNDQSGENSGGEKKVLEKSR
jgi:hypothetical protein